jgi:hypothetical protein
MDSSGALTVAVAGITISTTTSTSAATAVPKRADTKNAKFVAVVATVYTAIKFGASNVAATLNDKWVSPNEPQIFNVSGFSDPADGKCYFAALTNTGTGQVNVVPLEDA